MDLRGAVQGILFSSSKRLLIILLLSCRMDPVALEGEEAGAAGKCLPDCFRFNQLLFQCLLQRGASCFCSVGSSAALFGTLTALACSSFANCWPRLVVSHFNLPRIVLASDDASRCHNGSRMPGDNPFYSNIDSMPDIRPRRKSIPLVSELVIYPSLFIFFVVLFFFVFTVVSLSTGALRTSASRSARSIWCDCGRVTSN